MMTHGGARGVLGRAPQSGGAPRSLLKNAWADRRRACPPAVRKARRWATAFPVKLLSTDPRRGYIDFGR